MLHGKRLQTALVLQDRLFYGNRTGQALTEIMDKCSIAIAGLADYKHAGTQLVSSALKTGNISPGAFRSCMHLQTACRWKNAFV